MDKNTFSNMLEKISVSITDIQFEQFNIYFEILIRWNEVMNLTGITDYDEVQVKHFVDSLAVKQAIADISLKDKAFGDILRLESNDNRLDEAVTGSIELNRFNEAKISLDKAAANKSAPTGEVSIIDVGTGAGFPGLPLKIAFPQTKVTLLDSLNKRVKFLNEVIDELNLTGIEAIHSRAEDGAKKPELRESYIMGVSRAVANLATLSEYVLPFVRIGGYFVAYKSGEIDKEVDEAKNAVKILGGEISHIYKFNLPNTDIERSFVFIKKIKSTPKKYPRKSGLPGKEPLK